MVLLLICGKGCEQTTVSQRKMNGNKKEPPIWELFHFENHLINYFLGIMSIITVLL